MAQKTIDYILSLGLFKRKPTGLDEALEEVKQSRLTTVHVSGNPFAESDEDIRMGRVYTAKDADDLIRQCLES
jgi:hypothetical protein